MGTCGHRRARHHRPSPIVVGMDPHAREASPQGARPGGPLLVLHEFQRSPAQSSGSPVPPMRNVTFAVPGGRPESRAPSPSAATDPASSPTAAVASQPPDKVVSSQAPRPEGLGLAFARPAPPERPSAVNLPCSVASPSPRSAMLTLLPAVTSQRSTPATPSSSSSQRAPSTTPGVPTPPVGRTQEMGQSGASGAPQGLAAALEP